MDDDELERFARAIKSGHKGLGGRHTGCVETPTGVIVTWFDHIYRESPEGELQQPIARVTVIHDPFYRETIRHVVRGADAIGSGSGRTGYLKHALTDAARGILMNFGAFADDQVLMSQQRALIGTEIVRELMADEGGVRSVGTLYDIVTIDHDSARSIPYFYSAPVEPGYRTFVAMRPVDGQYVQEHRPTGTMVRVRGPFELDPFDLEGGPEIFDPARQLDRYSPGVVPDRNPKIMFSLYDPANVSPAIRESWGDDPLEPPTWRPDF